MTVPKPDRWWPEGTNVARARVLERIIDDVIVHGHRPCILLAEDDPEMLALVASALRRPGMLVIECRDGCELMDAFAAALRAPFSFDFPDLIVADDRMPGWCGLEVLASLRRAGHRVPFILMSAFADDDTRASALRLGAADVRVKPFDLDDLVASVDRILRA